MNQLEAFVEMSEELCGIPAYYLNGTRCSELYFTTLVDIVEPRRMTKMLSLYRDLPRCCQAHRQFAMNSQVLQDAEIGPIARNVIKLWFTGTWLEMPAIWAEQFRPGASNESFVPAPQAYVESLLGPAVGAHPAAAKPTGHQSWDSPPVYLPYAQPPAPAECVPPR